MPSSPASGPSGAAPESFQNVTCPFCGMLCDDLEIERSGETLKVKKNGCGRAIAGFERKLPPANPAVKGKDVSLDQAVREAAKLIGTAKLPLYGGLGTDVDGARAAMALAEASGGIVDHAASEAQYRNFRVLQVTGWTTSTLTEVRNRADLIVVVGGDIEALHSRFFDRIVAPPDSMFDVTASKRTVVVVGGTAPAAAKNVGEVVSIPCDTPTAGEVVSVLRARLRKMKAPAPKGIDSAKIDALAELCSNAKYGVIVWAPPALDVPFAELIVEQIAGLVKDLNLTTRFAGLSLGGSEGGTSAAAVSTWQNGYPLRVSYATGKPDYDPYLYSISRMLEAGEGDLLLWLASFSPDLAPPETSIPTIVLGTPGLKLKRPPSVFIPVGTPGVDHAGTQIRCDNVVSLPLQNLGRAALPRAADVLAAIQAAL